jgi:pyruvate dehydrogenase E2 component (dihydrolipoamide acetyltransferase)
MASINITIPDLGDIEDVEVIEVLVKVGDTIAADDPVIVLESAKASMDIPCPTAGTIESIAVNVGDKVNSGDALLQLLGSEEESESEPEPATAAEATETENNHQAAPANLEPTAEDAANDPAPVSSNSSAGPSPIHASPAVRRIASEHAVDLSQITGTGPHGRITKADIQNHLGLQAAPASTATSTSQPKPSSSETIALSRIQKLSAQHLQQSWANIPHVTHFDEADITDLEAWRQQLKQQQPDQALSLLPFVMKAVSYCLAQEPRFNSQLSADGESLRLNAEINLGIAVDTADGLVVPVIQQVEQQGVRSLAKTLGETAQRARDGKLSPADLKGGSFTISNLGGIGGQHFTPIINAPEVGILGLGQARWQLKRIGPPQQQGDIEDRLIQPLALSYDHRVIDGAVAARFIALLKQALEDLRKILL